MSDATGIREALVNADLIVDGVYEGGRKGNAGDDPLGPLVGVSNQGGFRHLGRRECPNLLVITTSMNEPDWPDTLDLETGIFTYFGDNRSPGRELHDTPRWGNQMLRDLFARAHSQPPQRHLVAPVFVFRTAGKYRDVRFLGLAVPGVAGVPATEDLVALWRHARGRRFQNYRAIFTILNVARITRAWINDIRRGDANTAYAPPEWLAWVSGGQPDALRSVSNLKYRTRSAQLPEHESERRMLDSIHSFFSADPYYFEECAAQLAQMLLPNIVELDLTRRSRDGGRDATGKYRIGSESTGIRVDFALEAKCYSPDHPVGVKDTSRLISRLRHRQFGILVTTSYVHAQAYREIMEDQHPILVICGKDIASILKNSGVRDEQAVRDWLRSRFQDDGQNGRES